MDSLEKKIFKKTTVVLWILDMLNVSDYLSTFCKKPLCAK